MFKDWHFLIQLKRACLVCVAGRDFFPRRKLVTSNALLFLLEHFVILRFVAYKGCRLNVEMFITNATQKKGIFTRTRFAQLVNTHSRKSSCAHK